MCINVYLCIFGTEFSFTIPTLASCSLFHFFLNAGYMKHCIEFTNHQ